MTLLGLENANQVSDEYYHFSSSCAESSSIDTLFGYLFKSMNRSEQIAVTLIKHLVNWCLVDQDIARFVFESPPPCLRFARFSDCFITYAKEIKIDAQARAQRMGSRALDPEDVLKAEMADEIIAKEEEISGLFQPWIEEQETQLEGKDEADFKAYESTTALEEDCDTLLRSYPPAVVIGPAANDTEVSLGKAQDDQQIVQIEVKAVSRKYAYSTPTGLYNMACPENKLRGTSHPIATQDYFQWAESNGVQPVVSPAPEGSTRFDQIAQESENLLAVVMTPMKEMQKSSSLELTVKLNLVGDSTSSNVHLPLTSLKGYTSAKEATTVFALVKIDPSKAEWFTGGELNIKVKAKEIRGRDDYDDMGMGGRFGRRR